MPAQHLSSHRAHKSTEPEVLPAHSPLNLHRVPLSMKYKISHPHQAVSLVFQLPQTESDHTVPQSNHKSHSLVSFQKLIHLKSAHNLNSLRLPL